LVTDFHIILARRKKRFSQLFNAHVVSNVRQTEIHKAESLVPEPSVFQVEIAIEKLIGENPSRIIEVEGRKIRFQIHKLINSIWNEEGLPQECEESITVPISMKGDKIYCSNYRGIYKPTTYKILFNILLSTLTPGEIIGDHQNVFRRNSQLLIIYCAFVKYLRKNGNTKKQCISSL